MIVLLIKLESQMRDVTTQNTPARRNSLQQSPITEDRFRWAVGIAITLMVIVFFLVAIAFAPASIRANNNLCIQQVANDEHVSLEALFQNPAQQDAFAQAVTFCSL